MGNSDSPAERRFSIPRRWRRLAIHGTVGVAVLATTWHLFASFLWISPPTPLRDLVPGNALAGYMLPFFGQSWSVFAPEPINGDYVLRVRAMLQTDDEEPTTTEWVNTTAIEQSWAQHNLFPPRAAGLSVHQASSLKSAWDVLNPEQQQIASLNYFEGDAWLGRMRDEMFTLGTNNDDVVNYMVQERYADSYATQVARAVWGDSVIRVQYETTRQNVIPFAERNNPDAQRPPVQYAPTGWRGLIVLDDQDEQAFRTTFLPAYQAFTREHPDEN